MREVKYLYIHCSDSPNGKHFTVKDIDDWHEERGFQRKPEFYTKHNPDLQHIGYTDVIYVDGSVHSGRALDEVPAQAAGYNANGIGVCLIGKDKFTQAQWDALAIYLYVRLSEFPGLKIKGHYQVDTNGKTCPNFDVPAYVARGFVPDPDDVLP